MSQTDQNAVIQRQFGHAAHAYVASVVHATGADLARIATIAETAKPAVALDLGAGGGHVAYAMAPHAGRVIASDLLPEMLTAIEAEAARRGLANITTLAAPAERLPLPDDACDMLACRFTVHHWGDAPAGLAEARRVLRAGGAAVFVDVVAPPHPAADSHLQAVELLRDPSHGRDYTVAQWQAMLANAGFAIETITPGRLRMDFADWTRRMATPADHAHAIRSLQNGASADVRDHFAVESDGSFWLDTVLIEAH